MGRKVLLAMAVIVAGHVWPAQAMADVREKAEKLAEAGELLFDAGKYADALKQFLEAYRLFEPPRFVIPEVLWNIGRCYEELGDDESAIRYFQEFRNVASDPEYQKAAENKIAEVRRRVQATLTLEVEPDGTTVTVDGRYVGETPLGKAIRLDPGEHTLSLAREGYRERTERLTLKAREVRTLRVALDEKVGTIRVVGVGGSAKGEVRVVVDGSEAYRGALPAKVRARAGRRSVRVEGPEGVEPVVRYLEVPDGGEVEVGVAFGKVRPGPAAPVAKAPDLRPQAAARMEAPSRFPWHFVVIGSGVAMVAGGGVLTALAGKDRSRVTGAETASDGTVTGITRSSALSYASSAKTKDRVSYVLYGVGGAAVVGGVLWWFLGDGGGGGTASSPSPDPPAVAASPLPGGVAVTTGWRF